MTSLFGRASYLFVVFFNILRIEGLVVSEKTTEREGGVKERGGVREREGGKRCV